MRHCQWEQVMCYLDQITTRLGSSVFDARCEKWWDIGQAVCAEAYGPNWMEHETFIEWSQKDDDEAPEPYYFECAMKMANGYVPNWVQ